MHHKHQLDLSTRPPRNILAEYIYAPLHHWASPGTGTWREGGRKGGREGGEGGRGEREGREGGEGREGREGREGGRGGREGREGGCNKIHAKEKGGKESPYRYIEGEKYNNKEAVRKSGNGQRG